MIQGVEMSAWDKERNRKVHIICYAPKNRTGLRGSALNPVRSENPVLRK